MGRNLQRSEKYGGSGVWKFEGKLYGKKGGRRRRERDRERDGRWQYSEMGDSSIEGDLGDMIYMVDLDK